MNVDESADIFEETHEDEDMVEMTAEEVLKQLEHSWINERNAPDLLEPRTEIVDCMLEQVKQMEQNLLELPKGDLRIFVHRLEVSRIKYVINSYLRTRLDKIQNNFIYYAKARNNPDNPSKLSRQEEEFLDQYKKITEDLFNSLCLSHLPGEMDFNKHKVPEPNLPAAVFIKVLEDVEGLEIIDNSGLRGDDTIDLVAGDTHIIQYSNVGHLVENEKVKLD